MLGFLRASHGRCQIDGFDPAESGVEVRRRVAYLPGDARLPRLDARLRRHQVLSPTCIRCGDLARSRRIAERLELDTRRQRGGSCRPECARNSRCRLCSDLDTPVLILDEPTDES